MRFNMLLLGLTLTGTLAASTEKNMVVPQALMEGLHINWIDTQVSPGQDFYGYANGMWQKNNPIPPEYAAWGSFNILNDKVQTIVHQMLIKASKEKSPEGSIAQKVGDFYFSGMDEASIDRLGLTPLEPEFAKIAAIENLHEMQKEIAHLHTIGVDVLFAFGSMQDFKDSTLMIAALMQSGLGLPNRDYYLKEDVKFQSIREAYVSHIAKMFTLLGDTPAVSEAEAKVVMNIEMQLAKASMSQIQQRDPYAVYHIKTLVELDKSSPNFSWSSYLADRGQKSISSLNEAMPQFFQEMNNLLLKISLADWKLYLRWHLIDGYASYLSKPFVDEDFKMASILTGTEKILPRWKRVVATENAALGFAIGKMYVEQHFSVQDQKEVMDILKNIRAVLSQDLQNLSWMTPVTRTEALKKLNAMEDRIGYPSQWWDYTSLKVDRGPYVLNVVRANQFLIERDLRKIGQPIDRGEWAMTPQTINAYYDPSMNNLNMPAGILQPPFFDPDAPEAVNYGAVGFIMGHEMTHGFDDQGAQFDDKGNLKNWWTKEDLVKFHKATECIANQFSEYTVDGGLKVQGKLVVGEASADLGGLILAYRAFHRSEAYKRAKVIDGLTPDQQFFLGAAHIWAMNIRPEQLRNQVTTDPHPPAKYRVNGTLVNIPAFRAAFGIKGDSPMVNNNPCVIW